MLLGLCRSFKIPTKNREGAIRGIGGYPGVGTVQGYAYGHDRNHETVAFEKRPSMDWQLHPETLARRRGVYFKVKQSTQNTLEGSSPFSHRIRSPQRLAG